MFAVQCSFCQHENVPGARFCAECGSPLHLRVCPNPDCGKVSDVNATRCEYCGTVLPKIALAEPGTPGETMPPVEAPQDETLAKKPAIAAWPLIIVAIVAGGLPLLWFNRAYLPAPKPWQREAAKPATEPLTPPIVVPQPLVPAATTAVPEQTLPAPPLVTEPAKPEIVANEAPKKGKTTRGTKKPRQVAETTAQDQPPRPCTEAVAAVGLCDPKQAKK